MTHNPLFKLIYIYFFKDFIYFFGERNQGERERNIVI